MDLRLIIGYCLLAIFVALLGGAVFVARRKARNEFHRRWGKQKRFVRRWL